MYIYVKHCQFTNKYQKIDENVGVFIEISHVIVLS